MPTVAARPLAAALLAATALGSAALLPAPAADAASAAMLPGRPPVGPLSRGGARGHEVVFEVRLNSRPPLQAETERQGEIGGPPTFVHRPTQNQFRVDGGVFAMPVAVIGTFHRTDLTSLDASIDIDGRDVAGAATSGRVTRSLPYDVQRVEIPVPAFTGEMLTFRFRQQTTSWESVIDDAAAALLPWPERYPEDVQAGLAPSPGIPSDDPLYAGVVRQLFGADVTRVAPYIAAKRIAAHVTDNFRLTLPATFGALSGTIDGFVVGEPLAAARRGEGSPVDLVMATVAVMRAAGIPARPVFGVTAAATKSDQVRDRETLVAWAECYIEGAGWVPFDPETLKSNTSWRNLPPERAWPGFGSWDDLDERIPIAFDFIPGSPGESLRPAQRPALYGVRLEGGSPTVPAQYVNISIRSLGRR